ncbi:MAG: hypothetical protein ACR2GR_07230 [Rhodothermales bacterium]
MRKWRGHRQPITLGEIERHRFWIGIAIGLGFAAAFYLFFGGLRDTTAVTIYMLGYGRPAFGPSFGSYGVWANPANPFELSPALRYAQNLFAASVAVAIAQNAMIRVWLTHRGWREEPRTRRRRLWSLTWSTMWAWLVAWYLLKFGQVYWLYAYLSTWGERAEPELDLLRDYGWLLALLVAALFLEQWKGLRLVYRCGRWMLVAAVVSIAVALVLALLQPLIL